MQIVGRENQELWNVVARGRDTRENREMKERHSNYERRSVYRDFCLTRSDFHSLRDTSVATTKNPFVLGLPPGASPPPAPAIFRGAGTASPFARVAAPEVIPVPPASSSLARSFDV